METPKSTDAMQIATHIIEILAQDADHPYITRQVALEVLYPVLAKDRIEVRLNSSERWFNSVAKN